MNSYKSLLLVAGLSVGGSISASEQGPAKASEQSPKKEAITSCDHLIEICNSCLADTHNPAAFESTLVKIVDTLQDTINRGAMFRDEFETMMAAYKAKDSSFNAAKFIAGNKAKLQLELVKAQKKLAAVRDARDMAAETIQLTQQMLMWEADSGVCPSLYSGSSSAASAAPAEAGDAKSSDNK